MESIQDELARIYADRELNRIDLWRGCAAARRAGLYKEEIAQRLRIPQTEVSRILSSIAQSPDILEVAPREVIFRFLGGRIEHAEMLETLKSWPYSFSPHVHPDHREHDLSWRSWNEVTDAFHRGLISIDDYQEILQAVHPPAA